MNTKPNLFICHASEDKDTIARPLADALTERNCSVWYDEYSLRIGDSLRRSIEQGLSKCRCGVVLLSRFFFEKEWPQKELDCLIARESDSRDKIILPVWHNITLDDVLHHVPILADRVALKTDSGIGYIADHIHDEIMFLIKGKDTESLTRIKKQPVSIVHNRSDEIQDLNPLSRKRTAKIEAAKTLDTECYRCGNFTMFGSRCTACGAFRD